VTRRPQKSYDETPGSRSSTIERPIVNYERLLSTIEPFDGTNFPKRNKEVHAVLKVLDIDYALYEDKTVNPSISTENHNEQLREYNSKLEK